MHKGDSQNNVSSEGRSTCIFYSEQKEQTQHDIRLKIDKINAKKQRIREEEQSAKRDEELS